MSVLKKTAGHPIAASSSVEQPATGSTGAALTLADLGLCVEVYAYPHQRWCYVGTRAQLQAEGVLPAELQWSADIHRYSWDTEELNFTLMRCRPATQRKLGATGSDCWRLICMTTSARYLGASQVRIIEAQRELRKQIHFATPAGHREWLEAFDRYDAARRDAPFQAFKARVPGLARPKPGRRAHQSKGQA